MSKPILNVAAGLIIKPDKTILIAQRPKDKAWSGWWELPGGKIEPSESPYQALIRELKEELGIQVTYAVPWVNYKHEYPKAVVNLYFYRVYEWQGQASGIENQELQWHPIDSILHLAETKVGQLLADKLLPAAFAPLRWLQIPDKYLISSINSVDNFSTFMDSLKNALESGIKLVQFREPNLINQISDSQLQTMFEKVQRLCRANNAYCLINSKHARSWWPIADGIHFNSKDACNINFEAINQRRIQGAKRENYYVAMSTHNLEEINTAQEIGADFAVLGHVLDTPSHADQAGMGWDEFNKIRAKAQIPVFAIGGQSAHTFDTAIENGAHGIAAIRGFI